MKSLKLFICRIANQRKIPKMAISHNHLIFDVHILRIYGHVHTKYEVCMSKGLFTLVSF